MKRNALLNEQLSAVVAGCGHGQTIVVVDAGYPIPVEAKRIDLAVRPGVPSFEEVLDALLSELVVEQYLMADESRQHNPRMVRYLADRLPNSKASTQRHVDFRETARWDLRGSTPRAFVRTGDMTAYGSVVLVGGWADETAEPDECFPVAPPLKAPPPVGVS